MISVPEQTLRDALDLIRDGHAPIGTTRETIVRDLTDALHSSLWPEPDPRQLTLFDTSEI